MGKLGAVLQKMGVKVMSATERKGTEDELAQIKNDLNPQGRDAESEAAPHLLKSRPAMIVRQRQLEEILNKDDDLRAHSGGERDRILSELKPLEEILKKERLTQRELALKPGSGDFEMAVKKQMYDQKHNGANLLRWQQLKRMLEPDNPLADNVELLDR